MKFVALALLTAVGFAGVVSSRAETKSALAEHCNAVMRGVDEPPVDCPFCGGNGQEHMRNMRRILIVEARVFLTVSMMR